MCLNLYPPSVILIILSSSSSSQFLSLISVGGLAAALKSSIYSKVNFAHEGFVKAGSLTKPSWARLIWKKSVYRTSGTCLDWRFYVLEIFDSEGFVKACRPGRLNALWQNPHGRKFGIKICFKSKQNQDMAWTVTLFYVLCIVVCHDTILSPSCTAVQRCPRSHNDKMLNDYTYTAKVLIKYHSMSRSFAVYIYIFYHLVSCRRRPADRAVLDRAKPTWAKIWNIYIFKKSLM